MSEFVKHADAYVPTIKQRMFHMSICDEVLYGGAAGGGKSRAIVQDAFARCMYYTGTTAVLFRRSYPELEATLIKEASRMIPASLAKFSQTRHEYKFINGSTMMFRHCESEKDMTDYQGLEIQWLYFDELTHFPKEVYDFLKSRLRAKKELGVSPCVRSASNPGGPGHGWVKSYFVDVAPYGDIYREKIWVTARNRFETVTRQYIPALATDNPHIDGRYVRELEKKPPALRSALLFGHWDAFEGQVFTEFKNDPKNYLTRLNTHVIEPFTIPLHWKRYRGFDFGYSRPFAVVWVTVSPSNVCYVYREWYGSKSKDNYGLKLTPSEIAQGINDIEKAEAKDGIRFLGIADPSIFDESRGESIAEKMMPHAYNGTQAGGVVFDKGDNTRLAGKMQIHNRLAFNENGEPGLYIFNNCTELIRTLPNLPYSVNKPEDVETDNTEDHLYDALRYVLMAWPVGYKDAPPPVEIPRIDPLNQFRRR